jgi:hypothetical protein
VYRRSGSPQTSWRKTFRVPEVIADTSPIQYLYQANVLHILPQLVPPVGRLESLRFRLDSATRHAVLTLAGETS